MNYVFIAKNCSQLSEGGGEEKWNKIVSECEASDLQPFPMECASQRNKNDKEIKLDTK